VKIFLGVAASAPVMAAAGALSRELQARAAALAPHARVSWVPADRLHLTVLFIGHVASPQADAVRQALERPFEARRFQLAVAGAGVFPPSGKPRVIWAGCSDGVDSFIRLQREAFARVARAVPLVPERDARPHLTLARVKDAAGLRARALLEGREGAMLGSIDVDAVTLFESRPAAGGVHYSPLMQTPLAPSQSAI